MSFRARDLVRALRHTPARRVKAHALGPAKRGVNVRRGPTILFAPAAREPRICRIAPADNLATVFPALRDLELTGPNQRAAFQSDFQTVKVLF
jgi:hypothetical protein